MTNDGKAGNGLRYRQTWKRRQKSELQLTGNTTIMVRFCRTALVKWQELIGKWQWITIVEMEIDYNMDRAVKVSFVLDYLLLQYVISKSRNRSISPCSPSLAWNKQTNKQKQVKDAFFCDVPHSTLCLPRSKMKTIRTKTTPEKGRNKIKLTFQILDRQNRLLAQYAENPYKRASPDCRKKQMTVNTQQG